MAYKYTKIMPLIPTEHCAQFTAQKVFEGMTHGPINKIVMTLNYSEVVLERSDLDNDKWLLTINTENESDLTP